MKDHWDVNGRLYGYWEDDDDALESFARRKDRRRPRGGRRKSELVAKPQVAEGDAPRFSDPDLQGLFERGKLDELIGELNSGKEATVYLARGPEGLMAAKVYADIEARSFRNDALYSEGRYVADRRIARAIARRTGRGLQARQRLWVYNEQVQLWELHEAGVPVPRPLVGPDRMDLVEAGKVVLMELIGDEDGAAPRLSEARLDPEEAREAFEQAVAIAARLAGMGKVHGDLSTYNLLWWRGRVVLIDLPQLVQMNEHPKARELLERDVTNLVRTFGQIGVEADAAQTLRRVRPG